MHDTLQKEIAIYEKRTRKSADAHARALKRIPLGVASNYRAYDPYPIFVKEGKGSKIRDIDGNEYIDHNLCFGALMAGHCHPAIVKAIEKALHAGTTFGMPHDMEWELAEEICARYPVEMVRFGSSGTEVTMHACRMARAATKRDKILKFERSGPKITATSTRLLPCRAGLAYQRQVSRTCRWRRSTILPASSGASNSFLERLPRSSSNRF